MTIEMINKLSWVNFFGIIINNVTFSAFLISNFTNQCMKIMISNHALQKVRFTLST